MYGATTNHPSLSCVQHWLIQKIRERCTFASSEVGPAACRWSGGEHFPVCALCMVCVDWCRFSKMRCFRRIYHFSKFWKILPFWYEYSCIVILLFYQLPIYIYICVSQRLDLSAAPQCFYFRELTGFWTSSIAHKLDKLKRLCKH